MAESIRDFLVGIGFKIDQQSYGDFSRAVEGATLRAHLLGDALESMAKGAVKAVSDTASSFERLFRESERLHTTVAGIRALDYALSQFGTTADAAHGAFESFGSWFKNNPGAENYLNGLGVATRDAHGKMLDLTQVFLEFAAKTAKLPEAQRKVWDDTVGIADAKTQEAMTHIEGITRAYNERLASEAAAGIGQEAGARGAAFEQAWRATEAHLGDMMMGFQGRLDAALIGPLEKLDGWINAHQGEINAGLTSIADALVKVASDWGDSLEKMNGKDFDEAAQSLISITGAIAGFINQLGGLVAGMEDLNEKSKHWWVVRAMDKASNLFDQPAPVSGEPAQTPPPDATAEVAKGLNRKIWGEQHPLSESPLGRAWDWLKHLSNPFGQWKPGLIDPAQADEIPFGMEGDAVWGGINANLPVGGRSQPEHPHTPTPEKGWLSGAWDAVKSALHINGSPVSDSNALPVRVVDVTAPDFSGGGGGGAAGGGSGGGGGGRFSPRTGGGGGDAGGPMAGEGAPAKGAIAEHAMRLMNFLVHDKGWTPEAAAIAAGNAEQESGIRSDGPAGDGGISHGMFQWNHRRYAALLEYAKRVGGSPSDEKVQFGFFAEEADKMLPSWKGQGNLIRAGEISHDFEGYGDNSTATRVANANKWLRYYRLHAGDPSKHEDPSDQKFPNIDPHAQKLGDDPSQHPRGLDDPVNPSFFPSWDRGLYREGIFAPGKEKESHTPWDKGAAAWAGINAQLPVVSPSSTTTNKTIAPSVTITNHVHTSDPQAAASMVGSHIDRAVSDLARNLQGSIQ